jgi:hypothetical protein
MQSNTPPIASVIKIGQHPPHRRHGRTYLVRDFNELIKQIIFVILNDSSVVSQRADAQSLSFRLKAR